MLAGLWFIDALVLPSSDLEIVLVIYRVDQDQSIGRQLLDHSKNVLRTDFITRKNLRLNALGR